MPTRARCARRRATAPDGEAASEVGPALFFSLLIITLSFVPVFTLQAQEGRLFAPLAFTRPMRCGGGRAFGHADPGAHGRVYPRQDADEPPTLESGFNCHLSSCDQQGSEVPRTTLALAALTALATIWPATHLGSEFMPPLDEGDLLYMPTALPGLAVGKGAQILQQTDRILKTFPEVERVFGRSAGRNPQPIRHRWRWWKPRSS